MFGFIFLFILYFQIYFIITSMNINIYIYIYLYRQMLYHDKLIFRNSPGITTMWNDWWGWWGWDLLGWLAGQVCIDPSCTKQECARSPIQKRVIQWTKGTRFDPVWWWGDGWACFLIEGSSWWGRIPVVSFCTRRRMVCHGNMMQRILGGDHLGLCLFCVFSRWETSCKNLMW